MRAFEIEISKPTNADSFENMCTDVYGVVFEDPTPKRNGRSGQKQGGVDIFIESKAGRIGIQCKRYVDGGVTTKTIDAEVSAADAGGWQIGRLIIATTAVSDTALVKHAQKLSDERRMRGMFAVEVESWTEICNHIQRYDALHPKYSPNSPGGAIATLREHNDRAEAQMAALPGSIETAIKAALTQMLPLGRADSSNGLVTRQLDKVNELLRQLKFDAAQELLTLLEAEAGSFDVHQKARWTLQNGIVHWQQNREEIAADWFLRAYEIFQDDERIAAGKIRAHIIQGDFELANMEGQRLLTVFPSSLHVWLATTNARICAKGDLNEADLPERFRDEADALQMMAHAFYQQGSDLAISYARRAMAAKGAGMFTRKGAASIIVSVAGRLSYMADFSVFSKELRQGLAEVIQAFSPASTELWRIENLQHRAEAAAHVALAHMLTGEAEVALKICERIEAELPEHADQITGLHLGALRFLHRYQDLVDFALTHLDTLEEDGLLLSAESAANQGNADAFGRITEALRNHLPADRPTVKLLDLVCRFNSGDAEGVLSEVSGMPLEGMELIALNGFAGLMFNAERKAEAHKLVEAIKSRVSVGSPVRDRLLVVDTLIRAEQFSDAIALLESVDPTNKSLPIQKRRLRALLRGGHRKKSKDLLDQVPTEWLLDDGFRRLAMAVAQEANDWSVLERLARLHRDAHPTLAESWVFWYQVVLHTRPPARIRDAFSEAPELLAGTPRQIAQLATAELQYGIPAYGYSRLYRMFRSNFDDVAAASAYLTAITVGQRARHEAKTFRLVTAGSRVTLKGADGSTVKVSIDPADMEGLPKSVTFHAADSALAKSMIGRAVGDSVEVEGAFDRRTFTIVAIDDAHHSLAELANSILTRSLEPAPGLQIFHLEKTAEGTLDVSPIHDRLKAGTLRRKTVMEEYIGKKIPIGFCAHMMGSESIDLIFGWDRDNPPLASAVGTLQELDAAKRVLNDGTLPVVIDAITLAELVRFGQGKLLSVFPRVYVCRGTYDRFKQAEVEAMDSRTSGHAADIDGKFAFIPVTDEMRKWKASRYTEALQLIESDCEICPVYGPEQMPPNLLFLKDVLDEDTYDVLTLCLEKNAAIFSVDEHLRGWVSGLFGIRGVFPYLAAMKAADEQAWPLAEYARFVLSAALQNRSIFSLRAADVFWGLQQPAMAVDVLELVSNHLATSVRIDYALELTEAMIQGIPGVPMQYGAAAEIVKYVTYGLFRREDLKPGIREWILGEMRAVANSLRQPKSIYPAAADIPTRNAEAFFQLLAEGMHAGVAMARDKENRRAPIISALFCHRSGLVVHT